MILLGGSIVWITTYTGAEGDIINASYIKGYSVSRSGYDEFENNSNITSIFISSSLSDIESYGFDKCNKLLDIYIDYGNGNYSSNTGN